MAPILKAEHDITLTKLMDKYNSMKLNPKKLYIKRRLVSFFSNVLSEDGLSPNQLKVAS